MERSLWWLVAGILMLDVGCQALHVTNQALILRGPSESHARLIGCYMLFYALGSGGGAIASTAVFAHSGWAGVCLLGISLSVLALGVWSSSRVSSRARSECLDPESPIGR